MDVYEDKEGERKEETGVPFPKAKYQMITSLVRKIQQGETRWRSQVTHLQRGWFVDPSLSSGMYWIDPDGQGVDPIHSNCDIGVRYKKLFRGA
jgi:hypothetical protein